MRVSSQQFIHTALTAIQQQRQQLQLTQQQLASGQRLTKPSDDPSASTRSAGIRQFLSQLQQFDRNADAAAAHLALQDGTLASITDTLQGVREKIIQSQSGIHTAADLQGLGADLQQKLDQLLQLANRRDSNGEFLFAGSRTLTKPFYRDGAGQYQYAGDARERELALAADRRITTGISGARLFVGLQTGNQGLESAHDPANTGTGLVGNTLVEDPDLLTGARYLISFTAPDRYDITNLDSGALLATAQPYQDGDALVFDGIRLELSGAPQTGDRFSTGPARVQDLFTSVQDIIDAIQGGAAFTTDLANRANRALENLDQALARVLTERAQLGGRMNAVDAVKDANSTVRLQFQSTLSGIEDLDYVEASSRLSQQSLALEAAQMALARVQSLSLFRFL